MVRKLTNIKPVLTNREKRANTCNREYSYKIMNKQGCEHVTLPSPNLG